jgi:hypothetical protein
VVDAGAVVVGADVVVVAALVVDAAEVAEGAVVEGGVVCAVARPPAIETRIAMATVTSKVTSSAHRRIPRVVGLVCISEVSRLQVPHTSPGQGG